MTTVSIDAQAPARSRAVDPASRRRSPLGALRGSLTGALTGVLSVVLLAGLWEGTKAIAGAPDAVMPHLSAIGGYLLESNARGQNNFVVLLGNVGVTLAEAAVGLLTGTVVGAAVGILSGLWALFGRSISPLLVLSQTMPIVAIAPAVVILLGRNWTSMAALAAILTFFPIAVAVTSRIRLISPDDRSLFESFGATRLHTFRSLDLPVAFIGVSGAMRTAAALALVGALMAELPSGVQTGIAAFLLSASSHYSTDPEALWAAALIAMTGGVVLSAAADAGCAAAVRACLRAPRMHSGGNP